MAEPSGRPTHGQMSWLITMVLVFGLAAVGLPDVGDNGGGA